MLAPAALASWIAASPTPPAPAWTRTVSPGLQVAELEQAVVGRAELDRDAGRVLDRHAVGDRVDRLRRHRRQLGVAAVAHRGDDTLADAQPLDRRADRLDRAGGLVPDDVRVRRQQPAGAVQEVAALDADRLDAEDDAARPQLGVGHLDVLEHVRPAGAGVRRSPHLGASRTGVAVMPSSTARRRSAHHCRTALDASRRAPGLAEPVPQ